MRTRPITRCPHCGSTEGVIVKQSLINIPWRCGFMGEEQDNGDMYDSAEKSVEGKMVYCQNCWKPICRFTTIKKQWKGADRDA